MISGDGQRVTYESEGQVFVLPAAGGTPFLVAAGTRPTITDDGAWVYFSAPDEDNLEIQRSLATGGGVQRMTRTAPPLQNVQPVVSGDGSRIAFLRYGTTEDSEGQRRLMVVNDSGSVVEQLGPPEADWRSWEPDITPDGGRAFFLGGYAGRYDVYRIQTDGSDLVRITNGAEALHPSVTEDGETIVFQSSLDLTGDNPCGAAQIFRVGADGSGLVQLTPAGSCEAHEHPVISRDGSTVVYQSDSNIAGRNSDGNPEAFLARTDGTFLEQVSGDVLWWSDPRPDISADGGRVAYVDWLGTPNYHYNDIWLYQPAVGTRTSLTEYVVATDTRISGDGAYIYSYQGGLHRLRISTGEIEWALGLSDARGSTFAAGAGNNTDFAVDGTGHTVFSWTVDPTGENPDFSQEVWFVDFEATPVFDIDVTTPARVSWTPDPRGAAYDVIRGDLANVGFGTDGSVDLGPVVCLLDDSPISSTDDPAGPAPGQAVVYLFRWNSDWGAGSSGAQRVAASGDCNP